MKRGLVLGILSSFLALTSFVSAAFFSDTLSFIDPTLITLAILFVVIFAVLYFATSKVFKGQTKIAAVISIALALLAVYWINLSLSLGQLFSGFGISNDNLYTFGSILFLALVIFLAIKLKFGVLLIIGGIMILAGVTNLVYSTDIVIIIGIVLVVIGIVLWIKKKRGPIPAGVNPNPSITHIHHYPNPSDANANLERIRADEARARREIQEEGSRERARLSQDVASLNDSVRKAMKEYEQIRSRDPSDSRLDKILQDINLMRSELDKLKNSNMSPQQEVTEETTVRNLENKTAQDERAAESEKRQKVGQERAIISSDIKTLTKELGRLYDEYNQIRKRDPRDPKISNLWQDINIVSAEIRKLRNPKINPTQLNQIQTEVSQIENKAQSDEGQAAQIERRDIQTATERNQQYAQEKERIFNEYKREYDRYMREYKEIQQEYNQLSRREPNNPRVQRLVQDAQMITNEVNRIKGEMSKIERGG